MDIKKLAPWNWFKKENENNGHAIPVRREYGNRTNAYLPDPFQALHNEIDRMFDNMFRGFGISPFINSNNLLEGMSDHFLRPSLDLGAGEGEYTVSIEIPGVSEKDVTIELVNDTLVVRGEKKQEKEEKNKRFYRLERSYGAFQRILSLPDDADRKAIRADFKNGVLNITIPRIAAPETGAKQIEINYA